MTLAHAHSALKSRLFCAQATTLQEQLNVSLAVIQQLECAAEEAQAEMAERRGALEASLEEAQVAGRLHRTLMDTLVESSP